MSTAADDVIRRADARAAFVAAGVNLLAGLVMLTTLRHGIPAGGSTVDERIAHVAGNTTSWRLAWLVWVAAAVSLLAFYGVLARIWRARAPVLCAAALPIAAAGLAADLSAETMLMIVSPRSGADFALVESIAMALTGFLGNGLYVVAGIALTIAGARALPRALLWLAAVVWAAGVALSVSTLVGSTGGQFVATALLMPAFVVWTGLVGRWLLARAS